MAVSGAATLDGLVKVFESYPFDLRNKYETILNAPNKNDLIFNLVRADLEGYRQYELLISTINVLVNERITTAKKSKPVHNVRQPTQNSAVIYNAKRDIRKNAEPNYSLNSKSEDDSENDDALNAGSEDEADRIEAKKASPRKSYSGR